MNNTLSEFKNFTRELFNLNSVSALLTWDMETRMPVKGSASRAKQNATIAQVAHERLTNPKVGEWLNILEDAAHYQRLNFYDRGLVRGMRRSYDQAIRLPESLVKEMSEAESLAHHV